MESVVVFAIIGVVLIAVIVIASKFLGKSETSADNTSTVENPAVRPDTAETTVVTPADISDFSVATPKPRHPKSGQRVRIRNGGWAEYDDDGILIDVVTLAIIHESMIDDSLPPEDGTVVLEPEDAPVVEREAEPDLEPVLEQIVEPTTEYTQAPAYEPPAPEPEPVRSAPVYEPPAPAPDPEPSRSWGSVDTSSPSDSGWGSSSDSGSSWGGGDSGGGGFGD